MYYSRYAANEALQFTNDKEYVIYVCVYYTHKHVYIMGV